MKLCKHLLACLFLLAIVSISSAASAQTVRGYLSRWTPHGPYPAGYVAVTLYSPQMGRSAPAYSTQEGFYFLYNVPPGQYVLEVWAYQVPMTSRVMVLNQPVTNIPPITIPVR